MPALKRHADSSSAQSPTVDQTTHKCPVCRRVCLVVNLSTLSPSRNFMALQWILPQFSGCPRGPSSSWMYCSHRSSEKQRANIKRVRCAITWPSVRRHHSLDFFLYLHKQTFQLTVIRGAELLQGPLIIISQTAHLGILLEEQTPSLFQVRIILQTSKVTFLHCLLHSHPSLSEPGHGNRQQLIICCDLRQSGTFQQH